MEDEDGCEDVRCSDDGVTVTSSSLSPSARITLQYSHSTLHYGTLQSQNTTSSEQLLSKYPGIKLKMFTFSHVNKLNSVRDAFKKKKFIWKEKFLSRGGGG